MIVLHVSAECYPMAKAGGLGDVVGAFNNEAKKQIQDKNFNVKKAAAAIIAAAEAAWPKA